MISGYFCVDMFAGIEEIASTHETEENIAVVTFGGYSRIAHHLSNDYSNVRNTIGMYYL